MRGVALTARWEIAMKNPTCQSKLRGRGDKTRLPPMMTLENFDEF